METPSANNLSSKPGEVLRRVLTDLPTNEHGPFVAWVEQRARRAADLELLREIKAYRQSLASEERGPAPASLPGRPPTYGESQAVEALRGAWVDTPIGERRSLLNWVEQLARQAADLQALQEIRALRRSLVGDGPAPGPSRS